MLLLTAVTRTIDVLQIIVIQTICLLVRVFAMCAALNCAMQCELLQCVTTQCVLLQCVTTMCVAVLQIAGKEIQLEIQSEAT